MASDLEIFNYIPEEVVFLVYGIPLSGFVDGTFIEITKDVNPYTSTVTADGTVSRRYNNSQMYTISFTIHNGSVSNDILTKLWQLDEITQRGKFPLLMKDGSGTDLFFSTTTWVETPPSIVKSNGIDGRTWTLRSSQGVINIGSNQDPSSIIQDIVNLATSALPALEGII
jgi:hypothetical protein